MPKANQQNPDRLARARGFQRIAGVDEAGRGPWAGPVVAAAVALALDEIEADLTATDLAHRRAGKTGIRGHHRLEVPALVDITHRTTDGEIHIDQRAAARVIDFSSIASGYRKAAAKWLGCVAALQHALAAPVSDIGRQHRLFFRAGIGGRGPRKTSKHNKCHKSFHARRHGSTFPACALWALPL